MSLRFQLSAGLTAVLMIFVLTLLLVGHRVAALRADVSRMGNHGLPLVLALDRMDLARSEVQQFLTDVAATHDREALGEAENAASEFREASAKARALLQRDGDTGRLAELDKVQKSFDEFQRTGLKMVEAYLEVGLEAGNRLMKGSDGTPGFDQASEQIQQHLGALRDPLVAAAQQQAAADDHAAAAIVQVMLWAGLAATLLAAAVGYAIVRVTQRRLGVDPAVAVNIVRRIGEGDLATPIVLQPGDTDSLLAHLHGMQTGLSAVVLTVRDKAQQVDGACADIERSGQTLAERTAQQSAALERTAGAMVQLSGTARANADGAADAQALAKRAHQSASQGGESIGRFVETMQAIQSSSREIAEIIGLIDAIAFQTRILALNASVEAARAGSHGAGFAVVAGEVRSLANRAASAAQEIKGLIATSVSRVQEGTQRIATAQAEMQDAAASIESLFETMQRIAQGSTEQSAGVQQATDTIREADRITQQNSGMVGQSAEAAAVLRRQAEELTRLVHSFQLDAARVAARDAQESRFAEAA